MTGGHCPQQAVILAGGKGTRLASLLAGKPKPLIEIGGVPLLGRQLEALAGAGFREVLLLINHEARQIETFCRDHSPAGLSVRLIDDGEARGTAGALLNAFDALAERFLVVYGDTLFDVDLPALWAAHNGSGADATLFLHPNDHPHDSDLAERDADGFITTIHLYPHLPDAWLPNLVNAALYVMERSAIAFWRDAPTPTDIAKDLFPAMLQRGARIYGYASYEYIKDVGTPKRLDEAEAHLRLGVIARARRSHRQKAVFIDRDGTVNALRGHLARAEDLELIDGAAAAICRLNKAEWRVVLVTNQPVLARGETSDPEMRRIHAKLETLLGREGAWLDALYLCPHHPDAGFAGEVPALKRACDCRKPAPGLVLRAMKALNIDLMQSWMVGDSTADLALAEACGLRSILVRTGMAGRDRKYTATPHVVANDLAGAVAVILGETAVTGAS